jgi:hypothetical protein
VNSAYTASRPVNSNRASAKAASEAHGTTTAIVSAATSTLLRSCRQNVADPRISR